MKEQYTGIGICHCRQCRLKKRYCSTSARRYIKRVINKFRRQQLKNENDVKQEPDFVNQQEAFRRFKRCNVERWVRNGVVKRHLRPKNIEYSLDELKKAAANRQDYLII